MSVSILVGDCRVRMRELADASVDSVVCDPPYHLTSIVKRFGSETAAPAKVGQTGAYARHSTGFMGQKWDGGDIAQDPAIWVEVLRVLKPGGHLVAFSGTRTYHRMAVAIEDAGFEIRDQLAWVYGSGFPKSLDVSKAIDKASGAERESLGKSWPGKTGKTALGQSAGWNKTKDPHDHDITTPATEAAQQWQGWGTALKPSWEPICLARRPLESTVAANVLKHGTGALNIDGCRIETDDGDYSHPGNNREDKSKFGFGFSQNNQRPPHEQGRWPANLCHDGSDEVLAGFPETHGAGTFRHGNGAIFGGCKGENASEQRPAIDGGGSAARFFYCAKATSEERNAGCYDIEPSQTTFAAGTGLKNNGDGTPHNTKPMNGNNHPTVKPIALMRWLCRLVTPPGGTILDPFMGSGSTLIAADAEQFNAIGCELSPEYAAIAERRIRDAAGMFADVKVAA